MGTARVIGTLAVGSCLLAACSSSKAASSRPSGTSPTTSTEPQAAWKSTSARIELSISGYWSQPSGYAKSRGDMSTEQLAALDGLRTNPRDINPVPDGTQYDIRIVDDDGTTAAYKAVVGNGTDDPAKTIDIDTLEPFLNTFDCARGTLSRERTVDAPSTPSAGAISAATALPSDLGCINGFWVPQGCSDSLFTFAVATPATYVVSGGQCIESLSLRVFSADGATLIGQSAPGSGDTCFTLSQPLDAGTYVLAVSKTNAAGCAVKGASGNSTIRIGKAP